MRILHLTLKKQWFDMVGNGKLEEYRELTPYWERRFVSRYEYEYLSSRQKSIIYPLMSIQSMDGYDQVLFANGGHFGNVPKKLFEFKGIEIREGRPEWGAVAGKKYFVIKLGKQLQ